MNHSIKIMTTACVTGLLSFSAPLTFAKNSNAQAPTKQASAAQPTNDNHSILPLEQKTVSFTQTLYPDDPIELGVPGATVSSKSYYKQITGAALKQGVALNTHGDKAVVRVTPVKTAAQNKAGQSSPLTVLQPDDLELTNGQGQFNVNKSGMAIKATSQQLNQAHPSLFKNTSAFVIDKAMGKGNFQLKTNKAVSDDSEFLIHVFDKHSPVALSLSSQKNSLDASDTLSVAASLSNQKALAVNVSKAELIAPDGRRFNMSVSNNKQGTVAKMPINFDVQRQPGELWKVVFHTEQKDNSNIIRTAELALDIHEKTAAINQVQQHKGSTKVTVNVEKPGRYEVRAWLFSAGKQSLPQRVEYQAMWLEKGSHTFSLGNASTAKSGQSSVVKQVQLMDQSRLAVLDIIQP